MEQVEVLNEVKAVNPRASEEARAELVRLQELEPTPLVERQIERLIRSKRVELLGPLAKVLERVEYERGRPVKAGLMPRPKTLFDTLEDPGWQTLRDLDVSHCSLQALVGDRTHRRVREVKVGRVGEFLSTRPALRTVRGLSRIAFPEIPLPNIEEAAIADVDLDLIAERFPSLRRLSLRHWGELEANWYHPLLERLERFSLNEAITFEHGVARFSDDCLETGVSEWVAHYPNLKRVELPDTALSDRLTDQLHACFKAVRSRGIEVVLVEGKREAWWGEYDNRYALRWG